MTLRSPIRGLIAALCASAPAYAASLDLKNLAADVTVIPEDRADVQVTVLRTNRAMPFHVRAMPGGSALVEGDRRRLMWPPFFGVGITGCPTGPHSAVRVFGMLPIPEDRLPQLVVRTPRSLEIHSSGAIAGVVGRSDALKLSIAGCDHWTIGDVRDALSVRLVGSGQVRAGAAGSADATIIGAGGIGVGAVANGYTGVVLGSGDVTAQTASGPIKAEIDGSGDVRIGGGHASTLRAHIGGSGDIVYSGTADGLDAGIAGSGDIRVRAVNGPVKRAVAGSGDIVIGP